MHARRTILSLCVLGILAALTASIDAGGSPRSKKKRITVSECKALVEQLVSPHKPPFKQSYVGDLPKGFSEATLDQAQAKIAYDKLSDHIEVSLPILMRHRNDRRFSYVYEVQRGTVGGYRKMSVGSACAIIVAEHVLIYLDYVEIYDDEEGTVLYSPSFIGACGGMDKWWKTRKCKSLAELQLEGIEWVLRRKKPRVNWSLAMNSEKEWAKGLKSVRKMAKRIRASRKPIRVKHHVQFFSK